jgi:hypothetical protein
MYRRAGILLLVIVLVLPAFSCTRLPEKPAEGGVVLTSEQLPALDSLPLAWGKLISVTSNPAYPGWFQLWFEDDMGTIRMATFNLRTGQLDQNATVFPRK